MDEKKAVSAAQDNVGDGTIRVHESVLAAIIKKTTLAIPGVVCLADGSLLDSLTEMVSTGKFFGGAVVVEMGEKSSVKHIDIRVVAESGTFLPDIGKKIQQDVSIAIESMTGMTINAVDVEIADIADAVKTETTAENQ